MYRNKIDEELLLVSDTTYMRPMWYLKQSTYTGKYDWQLNVLGDQFVFYKDEPVKTTEWKQYCDDNDIRCFPKSEDGQHFYFPIVLPDFLPLSCKSDYTCSKPEHKPVPPAQWPSRQTSVKTSRDIEYSSLRNIKQLLKELLDERDRNGNTVNRLPPSNPVRPATTSKLTMYPVPRCEDLHLSDSNCSHFLRISSKAWPLPPATWLHHTIYSSEDRKYYIYAGPIPMSDEARREMDYLHIDMEVLCVTTGLYMKPVYYQFGIHFSTDGWTNQLLLKARDTTGQCISVTAWTKDSEISTTDWKRHCDEHDLTCFVIPVDTSGNYYLVYALEQPIMCRKGDSSLQTKADVIKTQIQKQYAKRLLTKS